MTEIKIEDLIKEVLDGDQEKAKKSGPDGAKPKTPAGADSREPSQGDNRDGTVAVKNGQIVVKNPTGTGKYPSISPGRGTRILINDQQFTEPIILTEDTRLDIRLTDREPVVSFDLSLSDDGLEAYLTVQAQSGAKYRLADQEEAQNLVLTTEILEETVPSPIPIDRVIVKLNSLGIKYGIDLDVIARELAAPNGQKVVFARGQPPVPSQDTMIEYLFGPEARARKEVSEKDRIDHLDKGQFLAVGVGTVLAVKHPPVPGKNGLTVTGREIPAGEPKDIEIMVGEGVSLISQGEKAVATASGRPVLVGKNKIISIVPELTIPGNVDIHTGHIEFKGDVIIRGDVMEGLMVRSTGRVTVLGHVYSGHILASGDVIIGQNLVGGTIAAGGEAAFFSRFLPVLTNLHNALHNLLEAVVQLKKNPVFSTQDLHIKGDGNLVKLLIDIKFKEIPKMLESLQNYLKSLLYQLNPEVTECIELMNAKLVGLGPLNIKSLDELSEIGDKQATIIKIGQDALETIANVTVKYSQNAMIEATGSICITGTGSYHTNLYAGRDIAINGICRGGVLRATRKITAAELGSSTAVVTKVETNRGGKIRAGLVFPNVFITIDQQTTKVDAVIQDVQCDWDERTGLTVSSKR